MKSTRIARAMAWSIVVFQAAMYAGNPTLFFGIALIGVCLVAVIVEIAAP